MSDQLTPALVRTLFEKSEFLQAHATALALYAQQPDNYDWGLLFLQTAIYIERADSVIAVLQDIASGISPQTRHLLLFQAHLCVGNYVQAWQHLAQTGLANDSLIYHDCAFRIAFQEFHLPTALAHLAAIERLAQRPLLHFLKKFEIFKLQGEYAEIKRQIAILQRAIPASARNEQSILQLWQAGVAHNEHDFAQSLGITEQLIRANLARLLENEQAQSVPSASLSTSLSKSHRPNPIAFGKPWTRQRQHRVIKDLERLILMHQLPLFMVAGSLLALVREGDFFLSDKDIDLGLLDVDFKPATDLLVKSGYFDDISPPHYFVGYRQLRHRATGFIVDVTHYQSKGEHIYATWAHISGEILRQTKFAQFSLREAYFPSLLCRVLIPDQVENYLSSLYGDWRTPDPSFDTVVAARNLSALTPFLQSLSFMKIADALLNQRYRKAQASIKHLRDCGFDSPLLSQLDDIF